MRYVTDKRLTTALAALALLLLASVALAQSSVSFDQGWHVLSGGGAPAGSTSFAADGSLGQWAGGVAEGATYRVESGYWYGPVARAVAGDLNSDCVVDVVDVQLVASMWRCEAGDDRYNAYVDLDASGSIDVINIMRVVADWGESCS